VKKSVILFSSIFLVLLLADVSKADSLKLQMKCSFFSLDNHTADRNFTLPGVPFLYVYKSATNEFFVTHAIADKVESLLVPSTQMQNNHSLLPASFKRPGSYNLEWIERNPHSGLEITNYIAYYEIHKKGEMMSSLGFSYLSNNAYPDCVYFE
jgi:hypothetical protein